MKQVNKRLMNWASILEPNTLAQAEQTALMPFIHPHVALMPDAHLGKGATVGSVIQAADSGGLPDRDPDRHRTQAPDVPPLARRPPQRAAHRGDASRGALRQDPTRVPTGVGARVSP